MEQQNKLLYESCKKSMIRMAKQEECFRCPLLTSCSAALEGAPHYSCCPTASKAASRELIFTCYLLILYPAQAQCSLSSILSPSLAGWCRAGGYATQGCSCPCPTAAGARGEPDNNTRQPPPSLPPSPPRVILRRNKPVRRDRGGNRAVLSPPSPAGPPPSGRRALPARRCWR